eukprot:gnl/MRDRNA2_/MRDRNA2_58991_c0_seq1.p1 gnl/MRDRNA2_/MRDRNA2_58991_c0~~gnl/MRDRNA2_/MRDRNA2_58991_c0_seq1.p1  ORF type:complete len:780 (-),score=208.32 gnl/MRDRNA2_/MRDRNA2_58991_c0_seq1:305-2644(-)
MEGPKMKFDKKCAFFEKGECKNGARCPFIHAEEKEPVCPISGERVPHHGDWWCPGCGGLQMAKKTSCLRCKIDKPQPKNEATVASNTLQSGLPQLLPLVDNTSPAPAVTPTDGTGAIAGFKEAEKMESSRAEHLSNFQQELQQKMMQAQMRESIAQALGGEKQQQAMQYQPQTQQFDFQQQGAQQPTVVVQQLESERKQMEAKRLEREQKIKEMEQKMLALQQMQANAGAGKPQTNQDGAKQAGWNSNQGGWNANQGGWNANQGKSTQGSWNLKLQNSSTSTWEKMQGAWDNNQGGWNSNQGGWNDVSGSTSANQGGWNANQGGWNEDSTSMGTTANQAGWNTNQGGWSSNNYDSMMGQSSGTGMYDAQVDQSGGTDWWAKVGVTDSTPQSFPSSPFEGAGSALTKSSSGAAPPAKAPLGMLALDQAVSQLNEPSNPMIQQLEFEKQELFRKQQERQQRMLEMEKQMMALQQQQHDKAMGLQSTPTTTSNDDNSGGMGLAERLAMSVAGDALNNAQAMLGGNLGQTGPESSPSGVGPSSGPVDSNPPQPLAGLGLLDQAFAELNEPEVGSNGTEPGPAERLAMMVSQTKTATPKSSAPPPPAPPPAATPPKGMLGQIHSQTQRMLGQMVLEQAAAEIPERPKKVQKKMSEPTGTPVSFTLAPAPSASQRQKSSSSEKGAPKVEKAAVTAVDEYEVILEGEDNEHGMTLSTAKDLKVKAIEEGLAEEWNKKHPENPIGIGDALVEVNGKRAKAADLLMALYSSLETNDKHRLKFKRRAGA